ncbi:MAG: PaaI family thioesterase [Gordonia sp. (in: high G+C Gram-positive bacteria)]|uniref:PaaI family thioesterase n=1 Tax=Gordonia sp. (in: high G+C Gram-positive bacteria) TaxID=84139 RepID=UPI0039E4A482
MKPVFELPANPDPIARHPKAPEPGGHIGLHHSLCFGCGDDANPGLHIKVLAGEGFTVTADLEIEAWMQGGPNLLHGGLLMAAFDEVMGTAPLIIGAPVVTAHLETDFAKPIPVGSTLHFDGEVVCKERRKVFTRATAHIGDPANPVAAAHAIFIEIDPVAHFGKYSDAFSSGSPSSNL